MISIPAIIILGIIIAALWQFAFSTIYTFVFELLDIPLVSNDFLSTVLLAQSFLMGAIPCMLIIYFAKLPTLKCIYILLGSIVISCLLMEIWVGGFITVIGLLLARSAWIFLFGAIAGCYCASLLSSKK